MEILSNLALGFSTALSFQNLLYCFLGTLLGTAIGVLPGLGPLATMAMLLPLTFTLDPTTALIMLAGIYYGAQYGGSTSAILINLPGEATSIATTLDGYQMALQGRAGPALATAAIGSFFAGTVAALLIALLSPPLTKLALQFGAAEYFSLMVLGLLGSVALASGSVVKALAMVVFGILLGVSGQDVYTAVPRLTFGVDKLIDGFNFTAVAMGVFGLGEVIRNLEDESSRPLLLSKVQGLMLSRADFRRILAPIARGTFIGSLLGVLPGGGALLASFGAYTIEKKISRNSAAFGKGAIEGVAAPESANNAGAQTSFIPMLTLGIPSTPVMALMVGALIIHGIAPGPHIISSNPQLFWGLIASMWIGNLMLLLLNLPLIGLWVRLLRVPYHILFPAIVAFCAIGVFSLSNSTFDVFVMAGFGVLGYLLIKLGFEPAPMLLGLVLGPLLEDHLRRSLLLSHGDPMIFVTRPTSAALLAISLGLVVIALLPSINKARDVIFKE